jgi:ribbon-helix-helix CopG family protein
VTTSMHRLQISLPRRQMEFLAARARREGVSVAELIRRMVENEAQATEIGPADLESALSFAGIVPDEGSLIEGQSVSENVDLYLVEASLPNRASNPKSARPQAPRRRPRR